MTTQDKKDDPATKATTPDKTDRADTSDKRYHQPVRRDIDDGLAVLYG